MEPNRVAPIDVLVTWSVNSQIYRSDGKGPFDAAARMRNIHRGLSACCNRILAEIPIDADLLSFDLDRRIVGELLAEAVQVPGVGVPVATKVLHRKRRNFIPMIDSVVCEYYLRAEDIAAQKARENWNNKKLVVSLAIKALEGFRADLRNVSPEVGDFCRELNATKHALSPVRVLDILVWTKLRGTYGP